MHAGLHTPARILNQTFRPLGIPPRFMSVEIRSNTALCTERTSSADASSIASFTYDAKVPGQECRPFSHQFTNRGSFKLSAHYVPSDCRSSLSSGPAGAPPSPRCSRPGLCSASHIRQNWRVASLDEARTRSVSRPSAQGYAPRSASCCIGDCDRCGWRNVATNNNG